MHDNILNRLSELLGNNAVLGKELILLFADQTEQDLSALQEAQSASDLSSIGKISHKMKSSLLALGLEEEANSARNLEQACHTQKSLEAILPILIDYTSKIQAILLAIRKN